MIHRSLLLAGMGVVLFSMEAVVSGIATKDHGVSPSSNASIGTIGSHHFRYVDLGEGGSIQINNRGSLLIIREGGLGSITEIRTSRGTVNLPPVSDRFTRIGIRINNQDDVVGAVSPALLPALWRQHKLLLLGGTTFQSKFSGIATGIDDKGVICGNGARPQESNNAGIYTPHSFTLLRRPSDSIMSHAQGITHSGVIFGSYVDRNKHFHGIVWRDGECEVLPSLKPYQGSGVYAGNGAGWFVGVSGNSEEVEKTKPQAATIWKSGKPSALASLGGNFSASMAINEAGWIVGSATTNSGDEHAVAWDATGVHDLNTLAQLPSSDVTLEFATQVNDRGYIVGQSQVQGKRHVFELIPN